jgi:conjugative transfer pilus assembly protein TraH
MVPKSKKLRTTMAIAMGILVGVTSVDSISSAQASISALLSGMLVGAGAPAGYSNHMGTTYSGGYANISIPNQQYNVISFAPPNLSMGCGGINLFMGSFSFINAQQFVQLLTHIGQGLASYAFYEAIHTMCPSCAAILSALQSAAESMNNALRNTCQAGHGFSIANFSQNMSQAASSFGTALGSISGQASDFGASITQNQLHPGAWFSSAKKSIQAIGTSYTTSWNSGYNATKGAPKTTPTPQPVTTNMATLIPHVGNLTWRIMLNTEPQDLLSNIGPTDSVMMEMIMSLIGTTIISPSGSAAGSTYSAAGGGTSGYSGAGSALGTPKPRNLTFEQVINGTPDAPVYQCEQATGYPQYGVNQMTSPNLKFSCMGHMTTTSLNAIGWYGINNYVQSMLFGASSIANYTGPNMGEPGIVQQILNDQPLTADELEFDASSGINVGSIIETLVDSTGGNTGLDEVEAHNIATQAEPYIEANYDDSLAYAFNEIVSLVRSNGTTRTPVVKNTSAVMSEFDKVIRADQAIIAKQTAENNALVLSVTKFANKNKDRM